LKRPGRGVDHPPPSSPEVKKRVELYLFSPFVACGRVNLKELEKWLSFSRIRRWLNFQNRLLLGKLYWNR
jgi:hypothetical protein